MSLCTDLFSDHKTFQVASSYDANLECQISTSNYYLFLICAKNRLTHRLNSNNVIFGSGNLKSCNSMKKAILKIWPKNYTFSIIFGQLKVKKKANHVTRTCYEIPSSNIRGEHSNCFRCAHTHTYNRYIPWCFWFQLNNKNALIELFMYLIHNYIKTLKMYSILQPAFNFYTSHNFIIM